MKTLIAYYSRTGENYFDGSIKTIDKGNTEIIAEKIQKLTGGDLFQIRQKVPYSENYKECVKQASADLKNKVRPELVALPESLDEYDTFYLGFPSYCGTIPVAVASFLEHFNWEAKTIKPFCSNEGSGMGKSEGDIEQSASGAVVWAGLSVHGRTLDEAALNAWL